MLVYLRSSVIRSVFAQIVLVFGVYLLSLFLRVPTEDAVLYQTCLPTYMQHICIVYVYIAYLEFLRYLWNTLIKMLWCTSALCQLMDLQASKK